LMRTEVTGIFVDIYASINWTEQWELARVYDFHCQQYPQVKPKCYTVCYLEDSAQYLVP
jgi:hypothetical protein